MIVKREHHKTVCQLQDIQKTFKEHAAALRFVTPVFLFQSLIFNVCLKLGMSILEKKTSILRHFTALWLEKKINDIQRKVMTKFLPLFSIVVPLPTIF